MKKCFAISLLASSLMTSVAVLADDSAILILKGVINPNACNITLNDGTVDLGKIKGSELTASHTAQKNHNSSIVIDCDAPMAVTLSFKDTYEGLGILDNVDKHRLVDDANNYVGYYNLKLFGGMSDSVAVNFESYDSTNAVLSSAASSQPVTKNTTYKFGDSSTKAMQHMAQLLVSPYIAKPSSISSAINVLGENTIQLTYL